ncbi:MAG TPA: Vps62-related protein [Longimicrobiaceae bacterium]|nr:Vps62-related protein [Longimicrobiaceae bacterium]
MLPRSGHRRARPVPTVPREEPMPNYTEMAFGELTLAFTTSMEFRWNTEKTDSDHPASFYHPIPPAGFYALGSVGIPYKSDDGNDGNAAALCVRAAVGSGEPLAYPTGFTRIWQNKGMDSEYQCACWRPTAPSGYVALGHVMGSDHDTVPSTKSMVCVRKDLVHQADAGEFIYNTAGSHANNKFSAWQVACPEYEGDDTGLIAAFTFVGAASRDAPTSDSALWVLNLPFPSVTYASPALPTLTGYTDPSPDGSTTAVVDRKVYVPFTAVKDTEDIDNTGEKPTVGWQVANTPFYTVCRLANYTEVIFYYNDKSIEETSGEYTTTTGVTTEVSDSYSATVGIEVGVETGVSVGLETKVSAKLSLALGFSKTVGVSEFEEVSVTYTLTIPATTAAVLYVTTYTLQPYRDDGTPVGEGKVKSFNTNSFYSTQYPPATSSSAVTAQAVASEPAAESEAVAV